jgi:AcrR family transcriptional regulator
MSPRPAASRHDPTATLFLDAAARLMDLSLAGAAADVDPAHRPPDDRVPVALEWLRVEEVVRLAGASRNAFFARWDARDKFVRDALVYALLYRDGKQDTADEARDLAPPDQALSRRIAETADGVMNYLANHPRSYLLLHIGPLLVQHEALWHETLHEMRLVTRRWADGYAAVQERFGLRLRPGWTVERYALAVQAMVDGFLLRYRIQPDEYRPPQWSDASIFAETVLAFTVGVVDPGDGRTTRLLLDELVS